MMKIVKITSAFAVVILVSVLFERPLEAQQRMQFKACLDAVSERFDAAEEDITVDPGPVRNGNAIILWRTPTHGGVNGYCEVAPNNQIVNLSRGNYNGGGGNSGARLNDGQAQAACRSEAARRTRTDMRDISTDIANNNGSTARVNWRSTNNQGYCTVNSDLRVADFRDSGGAGNYNGGGYHNDQGNNNGQYGSGWQLTQAQWGSGNRRMDVTDRVRRLLSGNGTVSVNNQNMGGDPAYGETKTLWISARNSQGQTRQFTFNEGSSIDASQFNSYGSNPGGAAQDIRVEEAAICKSCAPTTARTTVQTTSHSACAI